MNGKLSNEEGKKKEELIKKESEKKKDELTDDELDSVAGGASVKRGGFKGHGSNHKGK